MGQVNGMKGQESRKKKKLKRAGEPVMEQELFSASPRAAQMARARLCVALGAFGSSYS